MRKGWSWSDSGEVQERKPGRISDHKAMNELAECCDPNCQGRSPNLSKTLILAWDSKTLLEP